MKRLLVSLLMFALVLLATAVARSDDSVVSNGYAYSGGHYWSNGVAYTRSIGYYWVPPTYQLSSCRCYRTYVAGYWQGFYTYTVAQLKTEDAVVNALTDRMRVQNGMAKEQQRHDNLLQLVRVTGLEQNFSFQGYFGGRAYVPGVPVAQGTGVYGYTYQQVKEAYGQTNIDLLHQLQYQQAGLQSQGAQTATSEANQSAQISQASAGRVAETNARRLAAIEVYKATEPPPQYKIETKSTGAVVGPEPLHMPRPEQQAFLKLSGPAMCVECHSGPNAKKGFQVSSIPTMSAEEIIKKVVLRLVSDDDKFRMPPTPAKRLTADQVRHFMGGQ